MHADDHSRGAEKGSATIENNRAAVEVPAELLKVLEDADAIDSESWLLEIMRLCWDTRTTPSTWHVAKVILI